MKILIVSQYYFPEQFQINEIAQELVRRGHQMIVICGMPNYLKGEYFDGYEDNKRKEEEIVGVKIIRCLQKARGHNPLTLLRNYYSFLRNADKEIDKLKVDFGIVLAYQLSPISSLPAVRYKKQHGVPLLLYCLDIWPESAKSYQGKAYRWAYGYVRKLSRKVYQNCDRILVTSRPYYRIYS